jgi:hypothetical protein
MAFGMHVSGHARRQDDEKPQESTCHCFISSMQVGHTLLGMSDLKPKRADRIPEKGLHWNVLKTKAFLDLEVALKARTSRSG